MPVALITGASPGLGLALARSLADDGWGLVIDARHPPPLDDAAAGLRSPGAADVVTVVGDVTDPVHRAALVDAARRLGRLDLLVNNASELGPSPLPHLADHPVDALEDVYRVNVVAPVALIQAALPLLRGTSGPIV